jgi:thymidylate synthase (FAD)
MKIRFIKPSYEIDMLGQTGIEKLKTIESCSRTCYKSEEKTTDDSYNYMIKMLVKNKHEAMLEFVDFRVKLICSRAFSHEIVRMRLSSFAQESQRYVGYGDAIEFIIPSWTNIPEFSFELDNDFCTVPFTIKKLTGYEATEAEESWVFGCTASSDRYNELLSLGWRPEQARDVLPNACKTEINIKTNLREWRHIFKLRTHPTAAPQMRELMIPLLAEMKQLIPIVFDDI